MNVALLAVDSNYPNLALMKVSAWHKSQGDTVGWYNPFDTYDRLYMAKVFSFTPDYGFVIANVRGEVSSSPMCVAKSFAVALAMTSVPRFSAIWTGSSPIIRSILRLTAALPTASSPVVVPTAAAGASCRRKRVAYVRTWMLMKSRFTAHVLTPS